MKYIPPYFETLYRDELKFHHALLPVLFCAEWMIEDFPDVNKKSVNRLKESIENYRKMEKEYLEMLYKESVDLYNEPA